MLVITWNDHLQVTTIRKKPYDLAVVVSKRSSFMKTIRIMAVASMGIMNTMLL